MAIELFVIQCTTCRARLKVFDDSAIGQILDCPKCGSFVQVVPPPGWKRPAGESSPVGSESSIGAPRQSPPSAAVPGVRAVPAVSSAAIAVPATVASPTGNATTAAAPIISATVTASANVTTSANVTAHASAASLSPTERSLAARSPAVPGSKPVPPVSPPRSGIALPPSGGAAEVATALAKQKVPTPPPLPAKTKSEQTSRVAAAAVAAVAAPSSAESAVKSSPPNAPPVSWSGQCRELVRRDWRLLASGVASGVVLGVAAWLILAALASKAPHAIAKLPTRTANDAAATAGQVSSADVSAAAVESETPPGPEALYPASANASLPAQEKEASKGDTPILAKPAETAANAPEANDSNVAPNKAAMQLTQEAAASLASPPLKAQPDDSTPPAAAPEANAPEPAAGAAPPEPSASDTSSTALAQIEMHLDDKLLKIDFKEKSLREFLDLLSEFSTIQIGLDREALAKVGKSADTKVTVRMTNVTVAQALEAALSRHSLVAVVRGGKLVVTTVLAKP